MAKQIPYGISSFETIRSENYLYVDKMGCIPLQEQVGRCIILVRPRRFGKSLFLSTLDHNYDQAKAAKVVVADSPSMPS